MSESLLETEILLDVEGVRRSYGATLALKDVTLRLPRGVIGLVGNNGAGKSTLLKVLLGILKPDAGRGAILGYDIRKDQRGLRSQVGYMAESAAVVPVLKGVEYVTLAGDLSGMRHRDARRRAHEVLHYVGLGELRYRRLEEYSTGNLQRLKLAAALVHDPALLLLDEPTNGLDPDGRRKMLRLLEELIEETQKSVILCTHLLADVQRFCRHVVILHQGQAIRAGDLRLLQTSSQGVYELAWEGNGERFSHALAEAGAQVANGDPSASPPGGRGRLTVQVPASWSTKRFFELAQRCDVLLTQLRPNEEDLESLFFRLTGRTSCAPQNEASPT